MRRLSIFESSPAVSTRNFALLSATLMAAAGIALPHTVAAADRHFDSTGEPERILPKNAWPRPSSLLGYNSPLNPETKRVSAESTVELRWRYTNNEYNYQWKQGCTAKKTIIGLDVRLSTAAHCFWMLTGEPSGLLKRIPGEPKAADYGLLEKGIEFAAFDAQVDPGERKPLALIRGISISPEQDWALLSVAPAASPPEGVPRRFDQIPAVKLADTQSEAPPRPARGQRVYMHGVQQANGERQLSSLGRYLGRVRLQNSDGSMRYEDVAGIKPKTVAEDTCMPGMSGGSFVATSKGKVTYTSGPLAQVINHTWAPALFNNAPYDTQPNNVTNEIAYDKQLRQSYQRKLRVNLDSFPTLCIHTVNLPNSVKTLNAGFGVQPPVSAYNG